VAACIVWYRRERARRCTAPRARYGMVVFDGCIGWGLLGAQPYVVCAWRPHMGSAVRLAVGEITTNQSYHTTTRPHVELSTASRRQPSAPSARAAGPEVPTKGMRSWPAAKAVRAAGVALRCTWWDGCKLRYSLFQKCTLSSITFYARIRYDFDVSRVFSNPRALARQDTALNARSQALYRKGRHRGGA
jgi:hypothetical protein